MVSIIIYLNNQLWEPIKLVPVSSSFSGLRKCSMLILYSPNLGFSHFSRNPWFLLSGELKESTHSRAECWVHPLLLEYTEDMWEFLFTTCFSSLSFSVELSTVWYLSFWFPFYAFYNTFPPHLQPYMSYSRTVYDWTVYTEQLPVFT